MLRLARVCPSASLLQQTLIPRMLSTTSHTGQEFSPDDPRNARYLGGKKKEVNPNFAIKMVAEEPIVVAGSNHTWCSGGHGHLGHPKVFINLDKGIIKSCGYCGKQFKAH